MAKVTPGLGPPRRTVAGRGGGRKNAASPATDTLARPSDSRDEVVTALSTGVRGSRAAGSVSQDQPAIEEGKVIELPVRTRPRKFKASGPPRFRIFIIDSGWNSVARRVLRHNFALVHRLHKEDPIYLLSRKKSRDFIQRHRSLIGRDPIIAVHDLEAIQQDGNAGFHGFRLHLGILRTPRQALTALQAFARFLRMHRQSPLWRRTFAANFAARGSSVQSKSSSTRCRVSLAGKAEAGEPICLTE
jgi:hypothetical protein